MFCENVLAKFRENGQKIKNKNRNSVIKNIKPLAKVWLAPTYEYPLPVVEALAALLAVRQGPGRDSPAQYGMVLNTQFMCVLILC